ncbi:hypothetical protein H2202_007137 [Exophiala xenobiotica]|nr:hypothetical protein H2202_007137 [Exophiala xenobiotica]KAK5205891.1 hypothetical protein LTR41_008573 [Exophiala xenobiotica]KAK5217101.1 hypothetical protein LTR72_010097 [Exophiala xenobiotica]KAK5287764.1 hypothetical protein LTR14_008995 [Exophiala xenobiotica]KAK5318627.1 hypothetical protein LTR93_008022 [Exophiala xenobiotica]
MAPKSNIVFYTAFSPNGHKVAITLEELGLPYEMVHIDLPAIQHKEPWFLAINPNGRIPAITDKLDDGTEIRVFESGSIQQYLVDRYDTAHKISYPHGTKEYIETNNWLFFQNAGLGPMQGQANHFLRYNLSSLPEQYSKDRYINETRRLYRSLDQHLRDTMHDYLVGSKPTIADIAITSWVRIADFGGVDISEFPHLRDWQARMASRPAVQKGSDTPKKVDLNKLAEDPEEFSKYLKKNEEWIRQGMEENEKR